MNAGVVNGAIANNAGAFRTTGALTATAHLLTAGATLAVASPDLHAAGAAHQHRGDGGQWRHTDASAGGVTNNASGTIAATGGTVKDDLITVYNMSIAAINTGAGKNQQRRLTGNVLSNTATITNNLTWTGTVSNAGIFNNNAGGTVSGLLTNTAGTTTNNAALNGGATVSGGTFAGSGTVTNLNVSGGTFAPRNGPPGTLMTVTGNLAFQSGAMYLVALNPTTASLAKVGGTASLNGTAAALYVAGNYVSKKYTILTATGGVSGTFGSLVNTNAPTNFTPTLSYDANNAYINLTLNSHPAEATSTSRTCNTLPISSIAREHSAALGALTQPVDAARANSAPVSVGVKADDMFLNLLLDLTVPARRRPLSGASQFAAEDETLACAAKRRLHPPARRLRDGDQGAHFARNGQPLGVRGAVMAAPLPPTVRSSARTTLPPRHGVVGGADYKITPTDRVRAAGGGTNFSIASALGNGRSDLFQAGVFGRQNIGAAYLSAALAYGWQDVTTNRTVALAGADVLQARFRAETFPGRFEGGYRFATPFAGITPYVAAQVISFNLPAYAEQVLAGAGTFALNYAGQTTTATRTELGLRGDKSFAVQDGIFTCADVRLGRTTTNNDRGERGSETLPGHRSW